METGTPKIIPLPEEDQEYDAKDEEEGEYYVPNIKVVPPHKDEPVYDGSDEED